MATTKNPPRPPGLRACRVFVRCPPTTCSIDSSTRFTASHRPGRSPFVGIYGTVGHPWQLPYLDASGTLGCSGRATGLLQGCSQPFGTPWMVLGGARDTLEGPKGTLGRQKATKRISPQKHPESPPRHLRSTQKFFAKTPRNHPRATTLECVGAYILPIPKFSRPPLLHAFSVDAAKRKQFWEYATSLH